MRPKKYDDIPNIETPWVDYSGQSVEKFIKQEILKRCGWLFRSKSTMTEPSYLYGFTDEDAYIKWSDGEEVSPLFKIALPGGDLYTCGISDVTIGLSDTDINYGDDINLIVSYTGTYTTNNITGVTTQTYHDVYVVVRRSLGDELRYYEIAKIKYEEFVNNYYNIKDYIDPSFTKQYFKVSLVDKVTGSESDITTLLVNVTHKFFVNNITQHEYPIGNIGTFSFLIDGSPVDRVLHVDIESSQKSQSLTYNIRGDYSVEPFECSVNLGFSSSHEFKVKSWVTAYINETQYTSDVVSTWFYYENPDQEKERVEFIFNIENETRKYYKVGEPAHICDFVIYNGSSDTALFLGNYYPVESAEFSVQLSDVKANTVYSISPVINSPLRIHRCEFRFNPGNIGTLLEIKVTIEE